MLGEAAMSKNGRIPPGFRSHKVVLITPAASSSRFTATDAPYSLPAAMPISNLVSYPLRTFRAAP